MARRHHHYERAVERFLRFHRIPYVSVNEARKTLLPPGLQRSLEPGLQPGADSLKSFDFVLYGLPNLLVEVKGRRVGASNRLDPWATRQDVEDLLAWESLFGGEFRACLLFAFWFDAPPRTSRHPDALPFEDIFEDDARWYALRTIPAQAYAAHMTTRSPRWDTVHIPINLFGALSADLLDHQLDQHRDHQRDAHMLPRPQPHHQDARSREPRAPERGTVLRRFGVPCG